MLGVWKQAKKGLVLGHYNTQLRLLKSTKRQLFSGCHMMTLDFLSKCVISAITVCGILTCGAAEPALSSVYEKPEHQS